MYDFTLLIVKDNLLRLSGQNPNLMDVCHWAILFSQRKIWCSLCSERLNGVYPVRCEQSGIQNVFPLLQSMSYKTPSQMLGPLSAHIVVLLQNQKSGEPTADLRMPRTHLCNRFSLGLSHTRSQYPTFYSTQSPFVRCPILSVNTFGFSEKVQEGQ